MLGAGVGEVLSFGGIADALEILEISVTEAGPT